MKKSIVSLIVLIVIVIIAIVAALFWQNNNSGTYNPGTGPGNTDEPYPTDTGNVGSLYATTTVSGKFICLPHKNASGPQTMECAYGMKADDGSNYALDWSDTSSSAFDLPMGKEYSVTGMYTPVEALSSNHWQIYDIKGIIKVSSYKESSSDIMSYPVGSKITLELKKPVMVSGTTIRAEAITEDSRCPSDVQCIQAGRVKVVFAIKSPSGDSTFEITPGTTMTTETLSITLDDVKPYPISTHKISDAEYRVLISVKAK